MKHPCYQFRKSRLMCLLILVYFSDCCLLLRFVALFIFQSCLYLRCVEYLSDLFNLSALALQIFDIYLSALTSHVFALKDRRDLF